MFINDRLIAIETLLNLNPLCYSTASIDSTKDKREGVGSSYKKKGELLQKSQIREISIPNISRRSMVKPLTGTTEKLVGTLTTISIALPTTQPPPHQWKSIG